MFTSFTHKFLLVFVYLTCGPRPLSPSSVARRCQEAGHPCRDKTLLKRIRENTGKHRTTHRLEDLHGQPALHRVSAARQHPRRLPRRPVRLRGSQIARNNLEKQLEDSIPDFRTHYRTVCCRNGRQARLTAHWDPEINPTSYLQAKPTQWGKNQSLQRWSWDNWAPTCKRMKWTPTSHRTHEINPK